MVYDANSDTLGTVAPVAAVSSSSSLVGGDDEWDLAHILGWRMPTYVQVTVSNLRLIMDNVASSVFLAELNLQSVDRLQKCGEAMARMAAM